jgi:hypothetical protein
VERSTELRKRLLVLSALGIAGLLGIVGCSDVPSKDAALEIVQHEVKEEATCTLPTSFMSNIRKQYTSKAICVPRDGGPPVDAAMNCLNALLASGATKSMPPGYMAEWPDEVSGSGFDAVSPYDRRARHLIYKGCAEMTSELREGRFKCGLGKPDRIVRVTKGSAPGRATVRYARTIKLDAQLPKIEAACGAVSRPAEEDEMFLEKNAEKKWVVSTGSADAPAPSASSSGK